MKKGFRDICFVVAAFIASRIFVAFGVFFGRKFLFYAPAFRNNNLEDVWWKSLIRWDAAHYINVAVNGYNYLPDGKTHNIVFFPLYPLLIRVVVNFLGVSPAAAGLVLSNAFFLMALLLLHRYTEKYHPDADPDLTILLMAFYPFGVFYSSVYNESLFLVLCVFAFSMFRAGKMIASASALFLLGLTRLQGLFVLASMGLSSLFSRPVRFDKVRPGVTSGELFKFVIWGLFSLSGFLLFVSYQHFSFGHWDAFIRGQAAFARHPIGSFPLLLSEMDLDPYHIMNVASAAAVLVLSIFFLFLKNYRLYSLWGLLLVLIPLSTGTFSGLTRYAMVFFPMVVFGSSLLKKSPLLRDITIMACAATLIVFTALFVRNYWIG